MSDNYAIQKICMTCEQLDCEYRIQEPMRLHTSFRIGGPADLFLIPNSVNQITQLLPLIRKYHLPLHIIGRGSNLLVRDEGVRGVVLALTGKLSGIYRRDDTLICEAGASLESVCRFALDQGLSGLEFAHGIPGSVGGAVYMNAGAYGGEIKDVLLSTAHLDENGELGCLEGEALDLSYRHSAYSNKKVCIISAVIQLKPGNPDDIRSRMEDVMNRRKEKQPLDMPSAGSTFKRPAGNYAAALIDQCGLKGISIGGAAVSEKHAGFLINKGNASCADMMALIRLVQTTVLKKTGYRLECEVQML